MRILFAISISISLWAEAELGDQRPESRAAEIALRRRALRIIRPEVPPPASLARGVIVTELVVEASGSVGVVNVLEAPTEALRKSAEEAVRQWRFAPRESGRPFQMYRTRGKLTFYCERIGGVWYILHPYERDGLPILAVH
jgi:TonB family protein